MSQKFSVNYLTSSDITPLSGNPGYIFGDNLLVGTNSTLGGGTFLSVNKNGLYTMGADNTGSCYKDNGKKKATYLDTVLNFGQNMVYTCTTAPMTYNEYLTFCQAGSWNQYLITKFPMLIQYVGQFGKSDYRTIQVIS